MNTNQLQSFIKNNAEIIADAVNEYTAACNIKFSEFSEEQQKKLKLQLAAIETKKLIDLS
jgi:PBP1b-binding outer membrane lipoprotein LpoB